MGLFGFKKKGKKVNNTLVVLEIEKLTDDAVAITFDVPQERKGDFSFKAGQYITIKKEVGGSEIRRSYSISSAEDSGKIQIGVKKVDKGLMSTYLVQELKVGDELEVLKSEGNFILNENSKSLVCFAAGSGITPIMSMLLKAQKDGLDIKLFYGNKTPNSVMFKEQLEKLTQSDNISIEYFYTQKAENSGQRFTKENVITILKENLECLKADEFLMCGPEEMIIGSSEALKELGVKEEKIRFELFTTPVKLVKETPKQIEGDFLGMAQMEVHLDGEVINFELATKGDAIVDAVNDLGHDAPYSCKGAVCCTCRAKVTEGRAVMDANYSLSDREVQEGYILTCQAHPATEKVVLDYDL